MSAIRMFGMSLGALALAVGAFAQRPEQSETGGIQPITLESFENAKSAELSLSLNDPIAIRMAAINALDAKQLVQRLSGVPAPSLAARAAAAPTYDLVAVGPVGGSVTDPPFRFRIQTPYSSVVSISSEAKRKFSEPKFPPISTLNAEKVVVIVAPGRTISTFDTVQSVVIKRNDRILKPLKALIQPTTMETAMGARRDSATGKFTFDFAAFSPDSTISIVIVGRKGNYEWKMPPEELRQLR